MKTGATIFVLGGVWGGLHTNAVEKLTFVETLVEIDIDYFEHLTESWDKSWQEGHYLGQSWSSLPKFILRFAPQCGHYIPVMDANVNWSTHSHSPNEIVSHLLGVQFEKALCELEPLLHGRDQLSDAAESAAEISSWMRQRSALGCSRIVSGRETRGEVLDARKLNIILTLCSESWK